MFQTRMQVMNRLVVEYLVDRYEDKWAEHKIIYQFRLIISVLDSVHLEEPKNHSCWSNQRAFGNQNNHHPQQQQ